MIKITYTKSNAVEETQDAYSRYPPQRVVARLLSGRNYTPRTVVDGLKRVWGCC